MLLADGTLTSNLSISDDLLKGLFAGGLGLLGTLATVAYGWFKDRDETATRVKMLDEATKVVTFWQTYMASVEKLHSSAFAVSMDNALRNISTASARVEILYAHWHKQSTRLNKAYEDYLEWRRKLSLLRRLFLLYVPPRRRAWLPRVMFYISLLAFPLLCVVTKSVWDSTEELRSDVEARIQHKHDILPYYHPEAYKDRSANERAELEQTRRDIDGMDRDDLKKVRIQEEKVLLIPFVGILLVLSFRGLSIVQERPKKTAT